MMTQEAPELHSSHRCTKATQRNSLWKKSRNNWLIPVYWAHEKVPTSRWLGKLETHSHHKPHPDTALDKQEGTPSFQLLPEKWGILVIYLAPNFKTPDQRTGFQLIWLLRANGACIHKIHGMKANKEAILKWCMNIHHSYQPQGSVQTEQAKAPTFPGFLQP